MTRQVPPVVQVADVVALHARHVAVVGRLVQRQDDAHVRHGREADGAQVEQEIEAPLKLAVVADLGQNCVEAIVCGSHGNGGVDGNGIPGTREPVLMDPTHRKIHVCVASTDGFGLGCRVANVPVSTLVGAAAARDLCRPPRDLWHGAGGQSEVRLNFNFDVEKSFTIGGTGALRRGKGRMTALITVGVRVLVMTMVMIIMLMMLVRNCTTRQRC
uniref:Uncharacterized protein n=1 Tax=Anopheles atroparvus TaxID=41427 RepID=A0A182JE65_ANOAO